MNEDPKPRWYGIYVNDAFDMPAVSKQLRTLIVDEPDAQATFDTRYPRAYVYTALSWDFLREQFPKCLVSIADSLNRKPAGV